MQGRYPCTNKRFAKKVLFLFVFFAFTCIARHGRCSGGLSQKWREERKSKNPKKNVWTCFVNLKIDSFHTSNTWFIICCRAKDYVINNKDKCKVETQMNNTCKSSINKTRRYRILWLDFFLQNVVDITILISNLPQCLEPSSSWTTIWSEHYEMTLHWWIFLGTTSWVGGGRRKMADRPGRLSFSERPYISIWSNAFPSMFPFLEKSRKYLAAKNTRFVNPGQQHASNMVPLVSCGILKLSNGIRSTFQRWYIFWPSRNNESFQFQLRTTLAHPVSCENNDDALLWTPKVWATCRHC